MKILKAILNFILDLIKGIIGFILIIVLIFVIITGLVSGWLYYKYGKAIKSYDTCVTQTTNSSIEQYIESQNFTIDQYTKDVSLTINYDLVLSPVLENVQKTDLPDFIVKPLNIIGTIDYYLIGKIAKLEKPQEIVCIKPVDKAHAEIFVAKDWYMWGSAGIKAEQAPISLKLEDLKLFTIKVPEDYIEYLLGDDIGTSLVLPENIKGVRSISFDKDGVVVTYSVADLIMK